MPADDLIAAIPEGADRAQALADTVRAAVARLAGEDTDASHAALRDAS